MASHDISCQETVEEATADASSSSTSTAPSSTTLDTTLDTKKKLPTEIKTPDVQEPGTMRRLVYDEEPESVFNGHTRTCGLCNTEKTGLWYRGMVFSEYLYCKECHEFEGLQLMRMSIMVQSQFEQTGTIPDLSGGEDTDDGDNSVTEITTKEGLIIRVPASIRRQMEAAGLDVDEEFGNVRLESTVDAAQQQESTVSEETLDGASEPAPKHELAED